MFPTAPVDWVEKRAAVWVHKTRNMMSCRFLSVPAVRAWAPGGTSSLHLCTCPLPPKVTTLQPHQHKGKLTSSTLILQLKISIATRVSCWRAGLRRDRIRQHITFLDCQLSQGWLQKLVLYHNLSVYLYSITLHKTINCICVRIWSC